MTFRLEQKARFALLACVILLMAWIAWAIWNPSPGIERTELERMAKSLQTYHAEHGKFPVSLDSVFPASDVVRVDYEATADGFVLRSKSDAALKIEHRTKKPAAGSK